MCRHCVGFRGLLAQRSFTASSGPLKGPRAAGEGKLGRALKSALGPNSETATNLKIPRDTRRSHSLSGRFRPEAVLYLDKKQSSAKHRPVRRAYGLAAS